MGCSVLLLADDEGAGNALMQDLGDEGFTATATATVEEALDVLPRVDPDVVLLELTRPDARGPQLCRAVRGCSDLPIVVVSAHTDASDVVAGLDAGAYVTEPVPASVLGARIRAVLRRCELQRHGSVRRAADLEIRQEAGCVYREGTAARLTPTEFRLLLELTSAVGRIVTREQLLRRVWGRVGDTRLLDVHIRRLRRKIEHNPDEPTRVVTVRGEGYRFDDGT